MSWYDVYDYETSADTYIKLRQAKKEAKPYEKDAMLLKNQMPKGFYPKEQTQKQEAGQEYRQGTSFMDPAAKSWGSVYDVAQRIQDTKYIDKIETDYDYNTKTIFRGLKQPKFDVVKSIKTSKPSNKELATYGQVINFIPLRKPIEIYKYKTIDRETGQSVVVPQTKIKVYAENQHNYFYMEGGALKSVAKDEVSPKKLEETQLVKMYKADINKKAEQIRKTPNPSSEAEFKKYEPTFMEKLRNEGPGFIGEQIGSALTLGAVSPETVGKIPSMGKSFVAGAAMEALSPVEYVMDKMVEKSGKGKYAHDEKYFEKFEAQFDEKGNITNLKEMDKYLKSKKKYETEKYPKGFSKETDAIAKKMSEKEIESARAEDTKKKLADIIGKKKEDVTVEDEYARIAGGVAETLAEFAVLGGVGKVAAKAFTKGTKIAKIAPKLLQNKLVVAATEKVIEYAVSGGGYGYLESIKNRDKGTMDHLKSALKEALFFGVGGTASGTAGKVLSKTPLPGIVQKGLKGIAFSLGGTAATLPLEDEETGMKDFATNTAIMAGFEIVAGGKVKGKTLEKAVGPEATREIKKVFAKKVTKEIASVSKKYKLDTPLKGLTKEAKKELETKTVRTMLTDIGKLVKEKVGSSKPEAIVSHYKKEFGITGHVNVEGSLKGSGNVARAEMSKNGLHVKYNSSYSEEEVAGAIRHEMQHLKDNKAGFKELTKPVKKPKTLGDMLTKKGHHEGYDNFEIGYLERAMAEEISMNAGKNLSKQGSLKAKNTILKNIEKIEIGKKLGDKEVRTRVGLEVPEGDTPLYKEKAHSTNRNYTNADNLPSYEPKEKKLIDKTKDVFTNMYRHFVDRQLGLTRTGKDVRIAAETYSKHHGTVEYIVTQNLVDRAGQKIGKHSVKSVLQAPKGEQATYEAYLFHKHNIARMKAEKPLLSTKGKPVPAEESQRVVEAFERDFPEFKKAQENYVQLMDDFMTEYGVDGDLLPESLYKKMKKMYPDYVPGIRTNTPEAMFTDTGIISNKVFKRATGSTKELMPLAQSVPLTMQRIVRAERRNRVYQSIVDSILENPEGMQKYAEIYKMEGKTSGQLEQRIKDLTGEAADFDKMLSRLDEHLIATDEGNILLALEKGKPIPVKINDTMLWNALQDMNKQVMSEAELMLKQFGSMVTQKFKNVTTIYNPLFAVRNAVKDVPTSYIYGKTHNPVTYVKNLLSATKDTITKNKNYEQFVALGGTTSNITKAEEKIKFRDANNILKFLDFVTRGAGTFFNAAGRVSETAPRLAEFKSVYKKELNMGTAQLKALDRAMFASGEVTVNFNRGGKVTKALDIPFPYLNAGVQGVDRTIRGLITEGAMKGDFKPIIKSLGVLTIPTLALTVMNSNWNKAAYDDLPDWVKDNNYVFPIADDKYLKFPKNRETAFVFSTLFERMYRYFFEKDDTAFENLDEALGTAVSNPIEDLSRGGFLSTIYNIKLGGNKDFFGRDIEPLSMVLDKRSKQYIYDERTSKASVAMAPYLEKIAGVSPKQTDYFIKSYFGILGSFYTAYDGQDKSLLERAEKFSGFTVDTNYTSKSINAGYEKKNDAAQELVDFELQTGIKDLKKQLKDEGETSTKFINLEIESALSPSDYSKWLELKEKKKELNSQE